MPRDITYLVRQNVVAVKARYPDLPRTVIRELRILTKRLCLSVMADELIHLSGRWYVTSAGLLRIAAFRRCQGIRTAMQERFCVPSQGRWVFQAKVYKSKTSRAFVGYGDADPSNTSPLVRGAEMRVAETRAVNRALRKAYGIGLCSVEELAWTPRQRDSDPRVTGSSPAGASVSGNGYQNGQPRLRDRLCLLIRKHQLDPSLVKAYAAEYCGAAKLRDASREAIEGFINHLAERASQDREGLLAHLSTYAQPKEVRS